MLQIGVQSKCAPRAQSMMNCRSRAACQRCRTSPSCILQVGGISLPRGRSRCPWREFEGWENGPLLAGWGLVCRRRRRELAQRLCARALRRPRASQSSPLLDAAPFTRTPPQTCRAAIAGPSDMRRRGVALGGGGGVGGSDEDDATAAPLSRSRASPVPRRHPRTRDMRRQGPGRRRRRQR
jgi:hypothetical protein